jgi:hypothetical protein
LLPVTARVAAGAVSDAGVVAGAAEVVGDGAAEVVGDGAAEVVGDGATGVPVVALDAAPSPWLFTANSLTW